MIAAEPRLFVVRGRLPGDNRAMDRTLFGCVLAWTAAACGGAEPPPPRGDVLELELGGANEQLGPALRAVAGDEAEPQAQPDAPPTVAPEAEVGRAARPGRVVTLRKGQTIYGLARDHLGDGDRWLEILELNGWTEAQAMRLRPGAEVKLPLR